MEGVKEQILSNDYPCEIEFLSKRGSDTGKDTRTFVMGIKIKTHNEPGVLRGVVSHLQYEGSFDIQEIFKTVWISGQEKPSEKYQPVAIARLTTELLERDLEDFLQKVFKTSLP